MRKLVLAVMGLMLAKGSLAYESWTDPSTGIEWKYELIGDDEVSVGGRGWKGTAIPTTMQGSIAIPSYIAGKSVTSIGEDAFAYCSGLASVRIPEGVTSIGDYAFYRCYALSSVTMPSNVTYIGEQAFDYCYDLSSMKIPSSVTSIGAWAFDHTAYFSNLPNGFAIAGSVLYSYKGIYPSEVTIPSGVTTISTFVFYKQSGLKSVTIPSSVSSIAWGAIAHCDGLMSIKVAANNKNYMSVNGLLLTKDGSRLVQGVNGRVTIPNGVVEIGDYAFCGFSGLTSVAIPSSVKRIADHALFGCTGLSSVTIPSSVTSIASNAFGRCRSLMSVTIPSSVTSIDYHGFSECDSLTSVKIPLSVKRIGKDAFAYCDALTTVYVSEGDAERVRVMLEDSGLDTSALTFAEWGARQYEFIVGAKSEIDVNLVGYTANGLPTGLKYDSKKGLVTGTVKAEGEYEVAFTKKGEDDVIVLITVRKETAPTIDCPGLESGEFTVGVSGGSGGIALKFEAESGVKSIAASNLPAGMKVVQDKVTKEWMIQGGATKTGTFNVVLTLTTAGGTKVEAEYEITVLPLHEMAVGTFNGFVTDGEDNVGTIQVTTTDAGKITAKVVNARGTFSFAGTAWDSVLDGDYSVTLKTKKGDELRLAVDTQRGWNERQMGGSFKESGKVDREVFAQRAAYGKQWYFDAEGSESGGWTFSYSADPKKAALTVTWNADGKTSIAGKLGSLKVSASGYCDVSGITEGAVMADFAPVVTVNKVKKILSIKTNLWFDRKNDHAEIGSAKLVE